MLKQLKRKGILALACVDDEKTIEYIKSYQYLFHVCVCVCKTGLAT